MPTAGDDRGGAAGREEADGHRPEATRAFSRTGSHAPEGAHDRTQRLSREEYPAAGTAEPEAPADDPASTWPGRDRSGAADRDGGPEPRPDSEAAPGAGAALTQVMQRPGADPDPDPVGGADPRTVPGAPEEPEPRGPRRSGGGRRPTARPARRRRFRVRRLVAVVLLLVLAAPPASWVWVWYTARADERPASDAILVLGASQYNGRPSPIFEARLAHALTLYREGVAPVVITVGGNQPGDNYTEGGSGQRWLVEQGVPAGDTVAVERGSDTLQSVKAVSGVFERHDWSSVVIVTDPWHSLRSRQMAEDYGMEAATSPSRSGPAVIERETQLWYITRETASLWYYWIFGDSSDIDVGAMPGSL